MRRCRGKKRDGLRCKKIARPKSRYCHIHYSQAEKDNRTLPAAIGGGVLGARIGGLPGLAIGSVAGAIISYLTEKEIMTKSKVFISFDYDHDSDLKTLLVGQSKNTDTPFEIADWSIKEHIYGDWKEKVRTKLRRVDQVAVICGEQTHNATGVSAEVRLAQEEGVPYFLLKGRSNSVCKKPVAARTSDKIYKWTWDNLKALVGGRR